MGYRNYLWAERVYFRGDEMPGYKPFMGYDPVNDVALIIWTSLTVLLDGRPTASTLVLNCLTGFMRHRRFSSVAIGHVE